MQAKKQTSADKSKSSTKTTKKNNESKNLKSKNNISQTTNAACLSKNKFVVMMISLILLVILLVVSVVVNVFQKISYNELLESGKHTLLSPTTTTVKENGSSASAIILLNNIIGNVSYPQLIKIKSEVLENSQVVRVKATLNEQDKTHEVKLEGTNNWVQGEDGYLYFNGVIDSSNTFIVSNGLTLPGNFSTHENSNGSHTIIVTVEALNYFDAYASIVWQTAPEQWLLEFGSGEVVQA